MRFPGRVDHVCKLLDVAEAAQARGSALPALEAYGEAEALMRGLIEDDPDEPAHVQSLGSALYAAGEVRLAHGDALGAVNTLRRAEQAYLTLRRFDPAPAMLPHLIADVRLRRARGLVLLDRAASALVDAQAAVVSYLDGWSGAARDEPALDVARVLAWNAWVTAMVGDPDLAVAAADVAIRIYCARATELNAQPGLVALHARTFLLAARLAAIIHRASGRADLADAAAELAAHTTRGGVRIDGVPLPSVETVASAFTLSSALTAADAPELRAALVAPAVEYGLRVPLERVRWRRATALVGELARAGVQIMADHPGAGLRIALEAHTICAGASELGLLGEAAVVELGPPRIALLHRAAEASEKLGRRELARDFGDSLIGACAGLVPVAHAATGELLASADSALTWHEHFLSSIGEADAARLCRDILASLRPAIAPRLRDAAVPVTFPPTPGSPVRIDSGDLLGTASRLQQRVAHDPDPDVLAVALEIAELATAHEETPDRRAGALSILCVLRRIRAERGGGIAVLRDAVRAGREAYEIAAHVHGRRERCCAAALSTALIDLYQQEHDIAVLDEAVALSRFAADGLDPDDPDYIGQLGNLGNALLLASRAHDDLDRLNESITVSRSALHALAPGDGRLVNISVGLASALWQRTLVTHSPASLLEAHMHTQTALQHMSPWHPKRRAVADLAADLEQGVATLRE